MVRQQRVADPGDQWPGDGGRAVARLQGIGQEGLDLVGGGGVAFKKVTALGDEGRAWWSGWQGRELGVGVILIDKWHHFFHAIWHGRQFRARCGRAAVPLIRKIM